MGCGFSVPDSKRKALAYETGVHVGDGCMVCKPRYYRVIYAGDLKNDTLWFQQTLIPTVKQLFGVTPRVYKRESDGTILLIINSKDVVHLKMRMGLPAGRKVFAELPGFIQNEEMLPLFIKGIADTDFFVNFKKDRKGIPREPRIGASFGEKNLVIQIQRLLEELGFKPTVITDIVRKNGYREHQIWLYGKKNLKEWIKKIGFENPKHLTKIRVWEKIGFCPPNTTVDERIMMLNRETNLHN